MAEGSLGERLRRRRWGGLRAKQRDVAAAARISPAQLCEIERGTAGTTEATLARLAAVLGLDPGPLREQAAREGRLARRSRRPAGDGPPPPLTPSRPAPGPVPPGRDWLEVAEAAAVLHCTGGAVRGLIRRGELAPARWVPKGGGRQWHWLVAAAAVATHDPGNARRTGSNPQPAPPPGHYALEAAVAASGLSRGPSTGDWPGWGWRRCGTVTGAGCRRGTWRRCVRRSRRADRCSLPGPDHGCAGFRSGTNA